MTTLERSAKPQAGAALRFQQADKGGLVAGSEADKRAACRMFTPEPAAAQQCSSTADLRKLSLLLSVRLRLLALLLLLLLLLPRFQGGVWLTFCLADF